MENLVAVVIPCFNDGAYVQQAVASILNQTFTDYKISIVDDGSDNETKAILAQLINEKVEVMYQENQGVSAARNNAIEKTNAKYILTLDADDYFEPTYLEKAVAILNADAKIGVVGCYYKILSNNKSLKIAKPLGGTLENFLLKNEAIASSLFRRKCWSEVGGYDVNMKLGYEDWEFWIAILAKGYQMKIIEEALFTYRLKPVSRDSVASEKHNVMLRSYIFNKHIHSFKQYFEVVTLSLFEENDRLRKKNRQLQKSVEYKLGKFISKPFKCIKRIIKS